MTPETLAKAIDLDRRIKDLRETLRAGPGRFLARDATSEYELRLSKATRDTISGVMLADLRGQLAAAEAEFEAL